MQSPFSGNPLGHPEVSVIAFNSQDVTVDGVDLEATVQVMDGFTLGGAVGYTEYDRTYLNPIMFNSVQEPLVARSRYVGSLFADYETAPLFAETTLHLRTDATYKIGQIV